MHPIFAGRLRLALYLLAWAGICALLTALFGGLGARASPWAALAFTGPLTLIYAFVCLSAWWVCRANPPGRAPLLQRLGALGGAMFQASLVWVVIGGVWDLILSRRFHLGPGRDGIPADLTILWVAGIVLYGQSIAAHYFLLALENARAAERRLLEVQVTAREAELRALRAQLNPHFLFNSLNSISALVGPDPEAARRMCGLLGDFLRTSLALGARERVALAEELALAERYLSIEQVRFGERLAFERRVARDAERCQVPPLLIQPLIENAVKHGVADRVEGGVVTIEACRRGATLEVAVENPCDPEAPPRRGQGLGLENVRQRLAALDPRGTRVEVVREKERFRVVLTLPAVEDVAGGRDVR
jgi:two-component system sensor histidine kinase AlgZ